MSSRGMLTTRRKQVHQRLEPGTPWLIWVQLTRTTHRTQAHNSDRTVYPCDFTFTDESMYLCHAGTMYKPMIWN